MVYNKRIRVNINVRVLYLNCITLQRKVESATQQFYTVDLTTIYKKINREAIIDHDLNCITINMDGCQSHTPIFNYLNTVNK